MCAVIKLNLAALQDYKQVLWGNTKALLLCTGYSSFLWNQWHFPAKRNQDPIKINYKSSNTRIITHDRCPRLLIKDQRWHDKNYLSLKDIFIYLFICSGGSRISRRGAWTPDTGAFWQKCVQKQKIGSHRGRAPSMPPRSANDLAKFRPINYNQSCQGINLFISLTCSL